MAGVKEYLDNQLHFLNKNIDFLNSYSYSTIDPNFQSFRFRRDLKGRSQNRDRPTRLKRKLGKFFNFHRKKHTKATAVHNKIAHNTESNKVKNDMNKVSDSDGNIKFQNTNAKTNTVYDKLKNNAQGYNQFDDANIDVELLNGDKNYYRDDKEFRDVRNLQDVYYKAVADAKKKSTVKAMLNNFNVVKSN